MTTPDTGMTLFEWLSIVGIVLGTIVLPALYWHLNRTAKRERDDRLEREKLAKAERDAQADLAKAERAVQGEVLKEIKTGLSKVQKILVDMATLTAKHEEVESNVLEFRRDMKAMNSALVEHGVEIKNLKEKVSASG